MSVREQESIKTHSQLAMEYFKEGYNCSQSVFLAFSDCYDMDKEAVLRISSSFGGGMGRLREVCGAVTGMFMAAGKDKPVPEVRTAEYYKKRPCVELVGMAAEISDRYREEWDG